MFASVDLTHPDTARVGLGSGVLLNTSIILAAAIEVCSALHDLYMITSGNYH